MDFITHLPSSNGKSAIWVIVDRLSKFSHFIALPPKYTAAYLASIFLNDIYSIHGLPRSIVSDRDPLFLSHFWRELFKQLGTKLTYSSAYHPETDGQTEVVNRSLECYLRCYTMHETKNWTRYLPLAQFWYNTSTHSSTGVTPFEAIFGRKPALAHTYISGTSNNYTIDSTLSTQHTIFQKIKASLQRAQQRMIHQANKHRFDIEFKEGDKVYLKLRSYRQLSVRKSTFHKLAPKYYGPFTVIKKVGKVAYELDLPSESRIHRVFHVSLLRPCIGKPPPSGPLPDSTEDGDLVTAPSEVIDCRVISRDGKEVAQLLVSWEGCSVAEALWVDEHDFLTDFPNFRGGFGVLSEEARKWKKEGGRLEGMRERNVARVPNENIQLSSPFIRTPETSCWVGQDMGLGDKALSQEAGNDTGQFTSGPNTAIRASRIKSAPAWAVDYV
ncbi:hypothetical protein OROGR_029863 [Orobanche gracilis]